ncbi:Hypothetical predicted protein [Marmota monax]|uniref:Protein Wnt n=2 Tax=Marmota TaxID=9992 RepID=A0A5E4BNR9_MARMO|nr:Hypothetical predicted protein [Marmota monax]
MRPPPTLALAALCLLALPAVAAAAAYFGLTGREVLTPFPGLGTEAAPAQSGIHLKQCDLLKLSRRQKQLCRREPGLAETLRDAAHLGLLECQFQFRHERWNCSLEGRTGLLKRGFKETAFLYAVSSAALTHALARACSAGRMERCTCDDSPGLESRQAWQWGVCGDNLKYSTKFLSNFLGPKRGSKDLRARADAHNTHVGIKAVKSGLRTTCKCHGVSGSCAVRTCWKQLSPFRETGQVLKLRYDSAVKVSSATNEALGRLELWAPAKPGSPTKGLAPRPGDLVYMEDSPSFCRPSKYSPGTAGRVCSREASCGSLCCGRGYDTQSRLVAFSCHCQETAFLYAVSSAALTHALARACSAGRMERCTCDDSPGLESRQAWQWGVCGDNLKYSTKFLSNFLGPKRGSKDLRARADAHNTHVGIKAVKSGLRTTCKCHGVSGSCAVRTCWKQLSPFRETGQVLKLRYDSAVKVSSATNEALGRLELWAPAKPGSPTKGLAPRPGDLVYMEDSPSFCRPSKYSPGTAGRVCSREASCGSLCCGRGYDTQSRLVAFSCHCQVQWCCYVECQQCAQQELVYTCKR